MNSAPLMQSPRFTSPPNQAWNRAYRGGTGPNETDPPRTQLANGSQTGRSLARRWAALALAFFALLHVAPAQAKCRTHRCWHKVSVRRHIHWRWRWVKAHPMPHCTWIPESGPVSRGYGPWSLRRYRVLNQSGSGAGGKYQIIYRTWLGYGGRPYGNARFAPPLEQEKIARRILAGQGIHAWNKC